MLAHGWRCLAVVALLAGLGRADAAAPAPEQLLPSSTTEFVSISDMTRLSVDWKKTGIAQLMHDPLMKPFRDQLAPNNKGFNFLFDTIGVSAENIKAACGGDLAWGVVLVNPNKVSHVLTMDLTGRGDQMQPLFKEMNDNLLKQGARWEQRTIDGANAWVFDLPNNIQITYAYKNSMLIITDHIPTLQGMLQRWAGAANDSLANVRAYQEVRRRSEAQSGENPLIRWYFEPTARMQAQMVYNPHLRKKKGDDVVAVLRKEGLDGVRGVGGAMTFSANGADVLVRAAAYAPQPFRGAMRMAKLPNEAPLVPDAWVPGDLSAYATVSLDLTNAFNCFDTLFERLASEPPGTYKEIMDSLHDDKDGPRVDIAKEIFGQLENRVVFMNDAPKPYNATCERFLFAVPLRRTAISEKILTAALHRCLDTDPRIHQRAFQGITFFEFASKPRKTKNGQVQGGVMPNLSIAIAKGYLFICTHSSLLEKILTSTTENDLAQNAEYQRLMHEMARLGMGPSCARSFIRLDVGVEPTYELMRNNQLDQANSIYSLGLRSVMKADWKNGRLRADASKLPPFESIKKYIGLAGVSATTDIDGWRILGVVLKK